MTAAIEIPRISYEEMKARVARIKPVVLHEGALHYIAEVDPVSIAFTWSPVPTSEATDLILVREITTYHTYGAPVFFKPSIGEVLRQIPTDLLDTVTAFRTELDGNGVETIVGEYHRARTTLFRSAS